MPRLVLLLATMIAATAVTGLARAADMPVKSRIGVIFAEPDIVAAPAPRAEADAVWPYAPEVFIPPLVNGYYGKPNSYYYRSYYGTQPSIVFGRLPYACGWHGYC
jgi:hypothetical protein